MHPPPNLHLGSYSELPLSACDSRAWPLPQQPPGEQSTVSVPGCILQRLTSQPCCPLVTPASTRLLSPSPWALELLLSALARGFLSNDHPVGRAVLLVVLGLWVSVMSAVHLTSLPWSWCGYCLFTGLLPAYPWCSGKPLCDRLRSGLFSFLLNPWFVGT